MNGGEGGIYAGNITNNRIMGQAVESYVAGKVDGTLTSTIFPFDIRNHVSAFEVKSCFEHQLGRGRMNGRGRFMICLGSHANFKSEAEGEGLTPIYYFVLKGRGDGSAWVALEEKTLSWSEVDEIIRKRKPTHRKDNVDFINLRINVIFPSHGGKTKT